MIEGQKFARKCSVTGEGMDEGYVFDWNVLPTEYACDLDSANVIAKREGYENYYKLCNVYSDTDKDGNLIPGIVYYTEWYNDDSDYQYIVKNGELVEID